MIQWRIAIGRVSYIFVFMMNMPRGWQEARKQGNREGRKEERQQGKKEEETYPLNPDGSEKELMIGKVCRVAALEIERETALCGSVVISFNPHPHPSHPPPIYHYHARGSWETTYGPPCDIAGTVLSPPVEFGVIKRSLVMRWQRWILRTLPEPVSPSVIDGGSR